MEAYNTELAFHSTNLTVKTNVLLCTWTLFFLSSTNTALAELSFRELDNEWKIGTATSLTILNIPLNQHHL